MDRQLEEKYNAILFKCIEENIYLHSKYDKCLDSNNDDLADYYMSKIKMNHRIMRDLDKAVGRA